MRVGSQNQGAIGGSHERITVAGRDCQPPFGVETECCRSEKHEPSPFLSRGSPRFCPSTHFVPLFPTLRHQRTSGQGVFVIFFNGDKDLGAFL
jgi:hypothetical protein